MKPLPSQLSRRSFFHKTLLGAAATGDTWFDVPQLMADTRDASC